MRIAFVPRSIARGSRLRRPPGAADSDILLGRSSGSRAAPSIRQRDCFGPTIQPTRTPGSYAFESPLATITPVADAPEARVRCRSISAPTRPHPTAATCRSLAPFDDPMPSPVRQHRPGRVVRIRGREPRAAEIARSNSSQSGSHPLPAAAGVRTVAPRLRATPGICM